MLVLAGVGVLLREVRDGVRGRVLAAEAADEGVVGFAGFGEGVVAGVEVLALLELVLQQIFLVGQFAVEAEELLLLFGEGLLDRAGQRATLDDCAECGGECILGAIDRGIGIRTLTSTLFFWCGFIFAVSVPDRGVSGVRSSASELVTEIGVRCVVAKASI